MKKLIPLLTLFLIFFTSCAERIVGTWNVDRYETQKTGQQNLSLKNIGTITFNKNNTGEKKLNYSVLGVESFDYVPFRWNSDKSYITISSENSPISKTWILIENKRKSQKWKSTDGSNEIQILELSK
ncbi:hypothetical protein [Flavobacterium sp.]|uniref:hypothetical protein n=1 Tax=Flavobacterium sp. TaxID=239 RepID=UPI002FD9911F